VIFLTLLSFPAKQRVRVRSIKFCPSLCFPTVSQRSLVSPLFCGPLLQPVVVFSPLPLPVFSTYPPSLWFQYLAALISLFIFFLFFPVFGWFLVGCCLDDLATGKILDHNDVLFPADSRDVDVDPPPHHGFGLHCETDMCPPSRILSHIPWHLHPSFLLALSSFGCWPSSDSLCSTIFPYLHDAVALFPPSKVVHAGLGFSKFYLRLCLTKASDVLCSPLHARSLLFFPFLDLLPPHPRRLDEFPSRP